MGRELCGRDDDPGPSPALCSTWGTKAGRRIGALWGATAVGERDGGVCHGGPGHLGQGMCVGVLSASKKSWRRVWGVFWEDARVFLFVHSREIYH